MYCVPTLYFSIKILRLSLEENKKNLQPIMTFSTRLQNIIDSQHNNKILIYINKNKFFFVRVHERVFVCVYDVSDS